MVFPSHRLLLLLVRQLWVRVLPFRARCPIMEQDYPLFLPVLLLSGIHLRLRASAGLYTRSAWRILFLTTEDEERITIPNNQIMGEILRNSFNYKVVESTIGIAYHDDPEKAVDIIRKTLKQFSQISSDPPPQIGIEEFGDSSINMGIRYWVPTKQYFQTTYSVNLSVYQALKTSKITIPFPQRDVHMVSQPAINDLTDRQGTA